jgi:hypothetical protein
LVVLLATWLLVLNPTPRIVSRPSSILGARGVVLVEIEIEIGMVGIEIGIARMMTTFVILERCRTVPGCFAVVEDAS